ncbi:carbon monoxide dehydrogenase subunit G [Methyloraptor flagellatus]|uniref:Carbon monoxide dehydrogenase subunit G n=1 Tax=Methyloraptor flagellatus TaxID=3162530 RepID=A0AAU7X945_9HYPH
MEMSGEYRIPAPRERVWAALNDPEILKACIPGCQELTMETPTDMAAKVVAKIGPVKATFAGKVKLENMNPPEGYTISGEGQGGVAGFAKGGADVKLTPDGDGTILAYHAKAQIGGKLAQLGARLIDSTAKMMADQFFGNFSAMVGQAAAAEAAASAPAGEASAEPVLPVSDAGAPAAAAIPASTSTPVIAPAASRSSAAQSSAPQTAGSGGSGLPQWVWIAGAVVVALILAKALF